MLRRLGSVEVWIEGLGAPDGTSNFVLKYYTYGEPVSRLNLLDQGSSNFAAAAARGKIQ